MDTDAANLDVTKFFVPKRSVTNLRLKLFKLWERLREVNRGGRGEFSREQKSEKV
jgi:hypothetical protein